MQKNSSKNSLPLPRFLTVTEKSLKTRKKIDRILIGQNSMTSETMLFAQSPSIGFKWEIGCTVPRNNSKSDVRS